MTDEDIKRCYKILMDSGVNVDVESENSPYVYYISIIYIGERDIERMVDYFEKYIKKNLEMFNDLQHYPGVDVYSTLYSMVKSEYLEEFKDDIKIQNREDNINDVLD